MRRLFISWLDLFRDGLNGAIRNRLIDFGVISCANGDGLSFIVEVEGSGAGADAEAASDAGIAIDGGFLRHGFSSLECLYIIGKFSVFEIAKSPDNKLGLLNIRLSEFRMPMLCIIGRAYFSFARAQGMINPDGDTNRALQKIP